MADWTDNPFASSEDSPFSDPSVTQAQNNVPEYNPFENPAPAPAAAATAQVDAVFEQPKAAKAAPAPSQPQPAAHQAPSWAQAEPPKETKKAEPQTSSGERQRQQEYEARAAAAQQNEMDDMKRKHRIPNFPPIPEKMQWGVFKPCLHIDIKGEIPQIGRSLARAGYYVWALYSFSLFWNFICTLAGLACSKCDMSVSCALATAYMLVFTPCALCCWYHPLYTGIRKDSSLRMGIFFFIFGIQFLFSCFAAVGFPKTGTSGIWMASKVVKHDKIAGILQFTGATLWILNAAIQFYILAKALKYYRTTGGSLEKAQGEAITGIASNETVQKAAWQGAKAGAQNAFSDA